LDFAKAPAEAKVGQKTVNRLKCGTFVQPENVIALRTASKAAGVRFVDTGSLAGAVAQPKEK
jgi:hypothetical protein